MRGRGELGTVGLVREAVVVLADHLGQVGVYGLDARGVGGDHAHQQGGIGEARQDGAQMGQAEADRVGGEGGEERRVREGGRAGDDGLRFPLARMAAGEAGGARLQRGRRARPAAVPRARAPANACRRPRTPPPAPGSASSRAICAQTSR